MVQIKISDEYGNNERIITGKELIEFAKEYIRKTGYNKNISDIKTIGDATFLNYQGFYVRPIFKSRKKYGYKVTNGEWSRKSGTSMRKVEVYDGFKKIGERTYSTGSTKGDISEAYNVLFEKGKINKEIFELNNGYYKYDNSPIELVEL